MNKTTNKKEYCFKDSPTSEWRNFQEFIDQANKSCNWLVLRNFEYLPNNFFENDKDVDVLCEDLSMFVETMRLVKCIWGSAAYETTIDNKVVSFDIRFLGDGYYDKLWQYKMLKDKIYTIEGVPRMNNVDYFYSLIYHAKVQKIAVKEVYRERIQYLASSINLNDYQVDDIDNNQVIANLLSQFMESNKYYFCHPIDINVPRNKKFFRHLSLLVRKGVTQLLPRRTIVLALILKAAVRIIPKRVKVLLKKLF